MCAVLRALVYAWTYSDEVTHGDTVAITREVVRRKTTLKVCNLAYELAVHHSQSPWADCKRLTGGLWVTSTSCHKMLVISSPLRVNKRDPHLSSHQSQHSQPSLLGNTRINQTVQLTAFA